MKKLEKAGELSSNLALFGCEHHSCLGEAEDTVPKAEACCWLLKLMRNVLCYLTLSCSSRKEGETIEILIF